MFKYFFMMYLLSSVLVDDVDNFWVVEKKTRHTYVAHKRCALTYCVFVCFAQFTNMKSKLQSSLSTEIDLLDDSDEEQELVI